MEIARHLSEIRGRIAAAAARAGRAPSEVRILAVSKLQPPSLVELAYEAGVRDFGENYIQELIDKRRELPHLREARWHLIGHLQTNKVKHGLGAADYFHAVDSEKLVREAAKRSRDLGRAEPWPVFIQVNIDEEPSKSGVLAAAAAALAEVVRGEPALRLVGLMCVPMQRATAEETRPAFRRMASLAASIQAEQPLQLSMGMSEDYEVAVEEGAHWVRIGRKLFGERPQRR